MNLGFMAHNPPELPKWRALLWPFQANFWFPLLGSVVAYVWITWFLGNFCKEDQELFTFPMAIAMIYKSSIDQSNLIDQLIKHL